MIEEAKEQKEALENQIERVVRHVKYTGFGEEHEAEITDKLRQGLDNFQIKHYDNFKGYETESNLYFERGKDGLVYFNLYDTTITNEPKDQVLSKVERIYVDGTKWTNTLANKEVIMLKLEGSVKKRVVKDKVDKETGEIISYDFTTWKKNNVEVLDDYKQYLRESFTYDTLKHDLKKFPIDGLESTWLADRIEKGLEKGGSYLVNLKSGDVVLPRWLTVNAHTKSLEVHHYDPRDYKNYALVQEAKKIRNLKVNKISTTNKRSKKVDGQSKTTVKDTTVKSTSKKIGKKVEKKKNGKKM